MLNLRARPQVLDKASFTQAMLEKLIWISAFMLVGVKHNANVGGVEAQHKQEVSCWQAVEQLLKVRSA